MRQYIIYFFLIGVLKIAAQNPIDIQVEIAEPYPTELEYYLQNAQNLFIVVTNTSGIEQKVYYQVRLVGINNGFDAQTSSSAKPVEPVVVPTYGALFYSGQELERDFAFSYPEDVVLNAVTPEQLDYITFNRALPEGTYQLCITARDYNTDIALNFQCSDEFTVSYGDIPIIYMPFQDEIIPANGNTHVTIGWEPPFTLAPPPGAFSYKLKMVDITDDPFGDIELLMNNPGTYPMLDAEDIPHEVYNYDFPPEIELVEGHQYALRVQATDNTGTFPISNNGYSEVVTFWYGFNPNDGNENGSTSTQQPDQNASDCFQNCYYEQQINTTPAASLAAFSEIQVGNFTIQALNFTNNNAASASGTGTIEIPFLNNIKVNVAFSNLSINGNGRVYSGLVTAVTDKVYDPTQMTSSISEEMNNFIRNGRVVAGLINGSGSIGLPLGLVQNIAGHNFMLGFTQMSFGPTQATCQVMQNLHIPQFGEQGWISMAMSDVCLIPAGFAGEYALHPVNNYNIPTDGDLTYVINGSAAADLEDIKKEATYLEMDCNGLKSFGLRGQIHFPESTLKKENTDGAIQEGRVIGTFATQFDRAVAANENIYAVYGAEGLPEEAGLHFMVELDIDPFQIAGVEGWGFEVANAWLDVSDFENPPGIKWPASYDDANITIKSNGKAEMQPTWTGIFIPEMELKTPPAFMGGNRREAVSVNNMIIDPLVTITIAAKDLIGKGEGDVDGWSLSMDSLFMTIVQNRIESGGFSGLLGMPITKENTYLRYTALIEDSNTQNTALDPPSYIFSVRPENDLEFPFMIAKASLSQNSYVLGKFTNNNAQQTYFETFLEGGVGISSELFETDGDDIPLTIPVVDFQLKYHSQDGFTESHFGFCEQLEAMSGSGSSDITYNTDFGTEFSDENFAGFPINIESAGLSAKSPTEFTFHITPRVSLAGKEGGIAGSVGIDIDSEYKTIRGEKKLQLAGMGVSSMYIYSETQGLTLEGEVEFYNDLGSDNVGNKGARGGLQVMLPMGLGVKLKAEFGRSVTNAAAAFGTAQNYNYWYLDGMAYFAPAGIPIAPAVGIYGIGGGVYVNMSRGSNGAMNQSEVNSMLGSVNKQPSSGAVMVEPVSTGNLPFPSFGSYGLKMATTLGTFPTEAALNMDVSIYAQFSKNTGINMIEIAGDAFLFTPLSMRSKANFWASANFKWEKVSEGHNVFDGLVDVYANVSGIIYGNPNKGNKMVGAAFHAEQGGDEEWYFYAGTADDRASLNLKLPLLPASTMEAYLMTGHGLPSDLPIPDVILNLMANPKTGEGKNKLTDSTPIKANGEKRSGWDEQLTNSGTGIAFGSEVSVSFGFDAKLIYAKLTGTLGFDINITQDENRTCYISSQGNVAPGINGWYARGQVYAGVEGAIGIQFNFAKKNYDLNLFTLGAAMMLSGGGPEPFWAEGRAGVYYSVLNGLVEGTKSFDLTVGNRCVPAFEDPFGGLEIIYENYPALNEQDVSVFVDPAVNFILPMDEEFILPVMEADGSTKDMTVILQIDHFFVKERDGATVAEKSQTLDNSRQTVTIAFDQVLSEKKYHDAEIKIIGYERKASGDIRLKDENNANWYEERKWAFKTGKTPYPIPEEEVVKTLPIRRQRFYMQEDNILRLATIEFSMDMKDNDPNTGYFPEDNDTWDYTYSVRWQGLDGGAAITRTLSDIESKLSINQVNFLVPAGLSNSTTYSCQLVRKQVRKGLMGSGAPNSILSGVSTQILYDKIDKTNEISATTQVNIEIPAIPGKVEEQGEDIIYQFYFRTSQYNKMQEKLLASTFETVEYGGATPSALDVKVLNEEGFDVFEIKGELDGDAVITAPRLLIEANESDLGAVSDPSSGFKGFCSMLRDAYYDFNRKTKVINDRDHTVTYSVNVGGDIGTVTKTLSNLREPIDYSLSIDHDAANIKFQYNDWITEYKGKLTDSEINNEWNNSVSNSQSAISNYLSQFANNSPVFSGSSSPFIRIPLSKMHSIAAADAVKMWAWSSNVEASMHNVAFTKTYKPPGSPINHVYSGTHSIHKWRTYMANDLTGFLDAIDSMSVSERSRYDLKSNLGFYKFSFENNVQYGTGHTPGYRLVKSAVVD
ncbi:MAG: hypothetical protein RIR11_2995 [Bacteroidota bacterium]